jgi:hypothetical protein
VSSRRGSIARLQAKLAHVVSPEVPSSTVNFLTGLRILDHPDSGACTP